VDVDAEPTYGKPHSSLQGQIRHSSDTPFVTSGTGIRHSRDCSIRHSRDRNACFAQQDHGFAKR
ncbi:hypothetical protein ACPTGO_31285, partial [Pseudomonas aeruginosa]|uniref:hypothetical protein n=1 Tax=Pseudomonas aeruginosa TaxID=287 RepID=UPI003CC56CE8